MTQGQKWEVSEDFEVYAEINDTEDIITFSVTAHYEVTEDDPAYSPGSGNSMLERWCPETYVEFESVDIDWSDDTEDLEAILAQQGITSNFTLYFSYDQDDCFKDGKDNRPSLSIEIKDWPNLLTHYSKDIHDICDDFAEGIEPDTSLSH
jgi:hypothetical protein